MATNGNDTLNGTNGADTLAGLLGNDTYKVNHLGDVVTELFDGGTDTIITSVLDSLNTYSLANWYYVENLTYSGTEAAQLKGNAQNNVIKADADSSTADTLYGNAGNDTLFGYGGNDSMMGGSGNDTMDGGAGNDILIGGTGNELYLLNSVGDRVQEYANGGFDTIESSAQKDLRVGWANYIDGLTYTGTAATSLYGNKLANLILSQSSTADTLYGYEGNDTLDGGGGADSLVGSVGNDTYLVASNDIVKERANEGEDLFIGTKTDISVDEYAEVIENIVYTGSSDVALKANDLDNEALAGSGDDTVSGYDGDDILFGGTGKDSVSGGDGNDTLYGGGSSSNTDFYAVADSAADTLSGGAGNDRFIIDADNDVVTEGADTGTMDVVLSRIDTSLARYNNIEALVFDDLGQAWFGEGSSRNDIIVGNQYDNYLVGGSGNDTISGHSATYNYSYASDVLEGGAGNDTLVDYGFNYNSGGYDVSLFGGSGNDLYVLGETTGYVGGNDTGGTDTAVLFGNSSLEALDGVENIVLYGMGGSAEGKAIEALQSVYEAVFNGAAYTGSLGSPSNATGNAMANKITGNLNSNTLNGLGGNDTIFGYEGNDTLSGGSGTDSLVGNIGNDWYYIDANDVVVEALNEGFDILASDAVTSYAGYANIEGLQYTGTDDVVLKNGNTNTTADYFGGGSGDDTLTGDGGNDTLKGGDGKDLLNGGAGFDSLYGEFGNDSLLGGTDGDFLDGADGNDTLKGEAGNDTIYGGLGNDSIDGGTENDYILGGDGVDTLLGGDGDDQLYSGQIYYIEDTVKSTMKGGAGNDAITGGDAGDTLDGEAGNDTVYGNGGNDNITVGGVVASTLYYQVSSDVVWGDELYGNGSTGSDTFILEAAGPANAAVAQFVGSTNFYFNAGAVVADFNTASDTIELDKATVGDGDGSIENVVVKDTAGAFAVNAEMVIFRGNAIANFDNTTSLSYFDASTVTTAIGSASGNYTVGAERIFVVDDGTSSAIFQFTSADTNATVSTAELLLLGVVVNNVGLVATDFVLG